MISRRHSHDGEAEHLVSQHLCRGSRGVVAQRCIRLDAEGEPLLAEDTVALPPLPQCYVDLHPTVGINSIPARLSRMPLGSFTLRTGLGAGARIIVLTAVGYCIDLRTADLS